MAGSILKWDGRPEKEDGTRSSCLNKVSRRARNGSYLIAEKKEYPARIGNYEEKRGEEGGGKGSTPRGVQAFSFSAPNRQRLGDQLGGGE